jgi:RHS repeat-associated protein
MREASGTSPGVVSLPSGGGGVSPLGDRFQPDLLRGTGNYAVPLHLPKGPNELQPTLTLTYSTGQGNGPFGYGWSLNTSRIERRTDRGVPTYTDADTFVIGGAEVLVPVGGGRYRPKTDTQFWFIEKLADHWRVRTGDGRTLLFGQSAQSRETNGADTFAWCLDEERDAAGNAVSYRYRLDGGQRYLEELHYGIFTVRIAYEPRPDRMRAGRAGFARVTGLRASRLELHCDRLAPSLMRTWHLRYRQAANGCSLLEGVTLDATDGGETTGFPPLAFRYTGIDFSRWRVHELHAELPPSRLEAPATQLVDLTGNGLPDVLHADGGRAFVWQNRGNGRFDGPRALSAVPSTLSLSRGNVALADLDGNGRVELFAADQPLQVAFEADGRGGFVADPIVFPSGPTLRLAEVSTRLTDVDGDGVTDVMATGRTHLLLYRHEAHRGWDEPIAVRRVADLEQFPDVAFGERGVRLADMTGDGLQDVLVVRSGDVSYWPHLGYGHWGSRVEMTRAPVFPTGYRDERVLVVDIDGDGCSDVVYVDTGRTLIWLNQAGVGFADPIEVPVAPPPGARPFLCDFFGDGRPGIAWDGALTAADSAGYRFLRFDDGVAPYLMTDVDNGMGGRFRLEHSNTTRMRLADEDEGRPWRSQLPFVVRVVSAILEDDLVTGRTTAQRMRYSDGVYDGPDRQFRGFTRVEVAMAGDDSAPTSIQEVTFFHGDPEHVDPAERDRQRALSGTVLSTKGYEQGVGGRRLHSESRQTWDVRLEHDSAGERVHYPFVTQIEAIEYGTGEPDRIERTFLEDVDTHGNVRRRRRESLAAGQLQAQWIRSEERFTHANDEAAWLVRLPVRSELRDADGVVHAVQIRHYDGPAFVGLPEGSVTQGLVTRTSELRLAIDRLPADYVGARDLTALGFERRGAGDTDGWYANTSAVRRDGFGNVIEQRDAVGTTVAIEYDADGVFPVRSTDARGEQTTFTFDARACEPRIVNYPDGRAVRHAFDPLGRLTAMFETDDAGVEQLTKRWLIDLSATPVSITSVAISEGGHLPAEFVAGTDFDTLDTAAVARVYYDGFGKQLVQVARGPDAVDGTRRFVESDRIRLNARGLVAVKHAQRFVGALAYQPEPALSGSATQYRYDVFGNVSETIGPGPAHFLVARDTFTVRQFEGAAAEAVPPGPPVRVETFDARSRLTRVVESPEPGVDLATTYRLTLDGRIDAIVDTTAADVTTYVYAAVGEPIRIVNREAGTRTYYRDAAGKLVERLNADGSRLIHVYDAQGRLIRLDYEPPVGPLRAVREVFYDTDPDAPSAGRYLEGRIALVREEGQESRFSYNRAGRTTREDTTTDGTTLTIGREYDLQGRPTAIVYPDNTRIEYQLDPSGSVREVGGVATLLQWGPDGILEGYRLANGVDVSLPRDPDSKRIERVEASRNGTTLREVEYSYDAVGTIATMRDSIPGNVEFHRYSYDGLYRLIGYQTRANDAAGNVLRSGAYRYDHEGNLLEFGDAEPLDFGYADPAHPSRLTSVTSAGETQQIDYNTLGHVRAMGSLSSIEYDPHDRVRTVTLADGTSLRFSYDAQSRRTMKEVTRAGVTTRVRYASGLFERHAGHDVRHVFLVKTLLASTRVEPGSSTSVYYLADHHGSLLMAANDQGTVIHQQRYTPFGQARNGAPLLDRYLGRERDVETGLLHLGARYYAPAIGRFISADWFVLENPTRPARMPQAYAVYSYALNNPLVFKDPSGMFFFIVAGIIAAAIAIAAIATVAAFAVGFIGGLIYGLANGQGWSSLLTALETALTTTIGMWLGGITGFLVAGPVGLVIGAVMGGLNGFISGMTGIYNWKSIDGWLAFLSDSTWGLLGTSLGNIVHVINVFWPNSNYRYDLSHRQNRHVYEGGFALKRDFAFTQGNVISNAGLGTGTVNTAFIANHEELHIWQSRIFGPIFQFTYVAWAVVGFFVATFYWFANTDEDWGSLVETAAYYDNPFEYWAYQNDSNWPPSGAHPDLRWA